MPSLNYQARFAPLVESGTKRQTIRATRKRPIKAGERLHHFTGMRTKQCRKLLESDCLSAEPIRITGTGFVLIGKWHLDSRETLALATADGFPDRVSFYKFFCPTPDSPDFHGQIIKW